MSSTRTHTMTSPSGTARRTLIDRFGGDGSVTVTSAPGRVNLIGGHTDYNDGFVLPVAIDRRTTVAGRPREDRTVRAYSAEFDADVSLPLDDLEPGRGPSWADYVAGVAAVFEDEGHRLPGADVVIDGDVPIGAGLASSASLEVAVGAFFREVAGADVPGPRLAALCRRAENEFVGVNCGIMDQFAVTLARRDGALFVDCRSGDYDSIAFPADVAVLVADTNVEHELVDSAYNRRLEECRAGTEAFDELLDHEVRALRDVSPAAYEAHASSLPEPVGRRCEHVVHENDRVQRAARALERDDPRTLGRLMYESHESLASLYDVSCAELDAMVDVLSDVEGVLGARMTGAGFGGCVVGLVRRRAVADAERAVRERYPDRTGVEPSVHVCEPASGCDAADAGDAGSGT